MASVVGVYVLDARQRASQEASPPSVEEEALEPLTVLIGVACSTDSGLNGTEEMVRLAQGDINAYCEERGSRFRFEFLVESCSGRSAVALNVTKTFKASGIDFIVGHGWSSLCDASLEYVNENDILLLSPSSSSPKLCIPDDNLFRLAPPDSTQGPVIAKMLKSYGIEAVVVMQRGDEWADCIYATFEPSYQALGGVIIHRIRYGPEDTEFSDHLEVAESHIQEAFAEYGKEHVALQVISFAEAMPTLLQAQDYPTLMNVTWFGTEGTVDFRMIADDAGEQASKVGLIGPVASPSYSYANLDLKEIGKRFGFYQTWEYFHLATGYDCCWIYALSVLEASSPSALEVKAVLPGVAADYSGASGPCVLDENGDRLIVNYALRGYAETSPGMYGFHQYGFYNATTDTISWSELVESLPH